MPYFEVVNDILNFFSNDWELYELLFSSAGCFLKFFADKFSGRFAITKLQATTPEGIANSDTPQSQSNSFLYTNGGSHSGMLFLEIWTYEVTNVIEGWPRNVKMLLPQNI